MQAHAPCGLAALSARKARRYWAVALSIWKAATNLAYTPPACVGCITRGGWGQWPPNPCCTCASAGGIKRQTKTKTPIQQMRAGRQAPRTATMCAAALAYLLKWNKWEQQTVCRCRPECGAQAGGAGKSGCPARYPLSGIQLAISSLAASNEAPPPDSHQAGAQSRP